MDPSDTRVSAAVGASAIAHCVIGAWASLVAQLAKNLPAIQETWVQSLSLKQSPGEGNGYPSQYSYLENPKDRGAWQDTVYEVTKSETRLSN